MKIESMSCRPMIGQRETTGQHPGLPSRTFEVDKRDSSIEISFTLVPESDEDYEQMTTYDPDQETMPEWAVKLITSTMVSSRRPRNSVVSIRPLIDGAPRMSMSVAPGVATTFPTVLVAITSSGERVHLPAEFEITVY